MAAAQLPLESMAGIAAELDAVLARAPASGYRRPRVSVIPALAERYAELSWQLGASAPESLPAGSGQATRWLARPVFVLGVPRSGTSLLQNLLDGHPSLAVLPTEGDLLTRFRRQLRLKPYAERVEFLGRTWIARLTHGSNLPPFWLLGPPGQSPNPYVAFARRLVAWAASDTVRAHGRPYDAFLPVVLAWAFRNGGAGISAWVEKTPYHELVLGTSLRAFPQARCLHVVRDPCATLLSRQTVEQNVHGSGGDPARLAQEIGRSFSAALRYGKRLGPARYRVVRYEDLAGDPEACMREVAAFLGIDFAASLLRPTVAGRLTASNSSHDGPAEAGIVLPPAANRDCDAESLAMLRRHAGRAAARFGYTLK